MVDAIVKAAKAVYPHEFRSGHAVIDIPPMVAGEWSPLEQDSNGESEPDDAHQPEDDMSMQGQALLGDDGSKVRYTADGGTGVLTDSLSLLRIGYNPMLSELERVRAHVQFVCMVLVMVGHSYMHRVTLVSYSDASSAWLTMMKLMENTANTGFVILLGASTTAPATWRELGQFIISILLLLWLALFSGFDDAAANWLWGKHEVHLCFADPHRHEVQNMMTLEWSKQDDLACLPPLSDSRGPFLAALWFLIAFIAWQSAAFAARQLGAARLLLPIAVGYAIFAPERLFRGHDWPFSLFEEGALYARALSKNAPQMWWLFALGAHLPPGFPLRLPGEGLRLRSCHNFLFTRRRTRAFWAAANVIVAVSATPIGWALAGAEACGPPWSECSAAGALVFVLARLIRMVLQVIAALGVCAMVPTRLTPVTHAGRDSLAILLLNGYALALFKVPITMSHLFARERFGELTAAAMLVGICALLAVGTVNAASLVLQPARSIILDATVHMHRGRRAKAAKRVLPLVCVLISVMLFIRTTNAPLPPTVAPTTTRSHAYLHLSTAEARHERRVAARNEKGQKVQRKAEKEARKEAKKVAKRAQKLAKQNATSDTKAEKQAGTGRDGTRRPASSSEQARTRAFNQKRPLRLRVGHIAEDDVLGIEPVDPNGGAPAGQDHWG